MIIKKTNRQIGATTKLLDELSKVIEEGKGVKQKHIFIVPYYNMIPHLKDRINNLDIHTPVLFLKLDELTRYLIMLSFQKCRYNEEYEYKDSQVYIWADEIPTEAFNTTVVPFIDNLQDMSKNCVFKNYCVVTNYPKKHDWYTKRLDSHEGITIEMRIR